MTPEEKRAAKRQQRREECAALEPGTPAEQDAALRALRAPIVRLPSELPAPPAELARRLAWSRAHAGTEMENHAPLWRRDALLQAGGLAAGPEAARERMAALGWRFPGQTVEPVAPSEPIPHTLFLSLSGRAWAWPLTRAFLEAQTLPHAQIRLCVLETSQNAAFANEIRAWLEGADYAATTFLQAAPAAAQVADRPRPDVLDEVRHAVAAIYNTFARTCRSPIALFLEDDVIPPLDAYIRLVALLQGETLSVSGVVNGRHEKYRRGEPIAWRWDERGERENLPHRSGVERVGGTGFGCLAARGDLLRRTVFRSGPPWDDFDFNFFFDHAWVDHRPALLDWGCVCHHHDHAGQWV